MTHRPYVLAACALAFTISGVASAAENGKPTIEVHKQAREATIGPMEGSDNAFLEDVVSSDDPDAPVTCAFFRLEQGEPLNYTYDYDEIKIVLEGHMTIADADGEHEVSAGDVVYLPNGVETTFTTDESALAFTCGQREGGGA